MERPPRLPTTRQRAQAEGVAKYFIRKKCRNGHLAERSTRTGICVECARQRRHRAAGWAERYRKNYQGSYRQTARYAQAQARYWESRAKRLSE